MPTPSKDIEHLMPGTLWTIGPNKKRTDYSWVGDVYEVIRVLGPTVFLRLRFPSRSYGNVIDVQFSHHDWYEADDLLEELKGHEDQSSKAFETRRQNTTETQNQ